MSREGWSELLRRVSVWCFYLLWIVVPVVVTPWNFELFEFNKMVATYLLAIIAGVAWVGRMIVEKRLIWRRTVFDVLWGAFLLSQVAAAIFGIDIHTSIFGYYSRFNGGLLSTLSYAVLFYAAVNNLRRKEARRGIWVLLFAAVGVSIYGILEHFGIDKDLWIQDVQNRVFSSLGQPNWLAAWLVAIMPLTWALYLTSKAKAQKGLLFVFAAIYFLTLLYTKSRSGFLGFGVAWGGFWAGVVILERIRKRVGVNLKGWLRPFVVINLPILALVILVGTPWTPSASEVLIKEKPTETATMPQVGTQLDTGGTDSGKIRRIVWQGAIDIWKANPVFGTGVETFAYSYYNFRPREHNDVSEWDFLYNKAHNEFLNMAANTGTVGLAAYLVFILGSMWWMGKKVLKAEPEDGSLILGMIAGFVSINVTNFFGFSVVPVALLFFLFPAFSVIVSGGEAIKETEGRLEKGQKIWLVILGIVMIFGLGNVARYWYGDFDFAKGVKLTKSGNLTNGLSFLRTAVSINGGEPNYHSELSQSLAAMAQAFNRQGEKETVNSLVEETIEESDKAVRISPRHVNLWKDRTVVFFRLAEIEGKYLEKAVEALETGARLSPTDPKVFHNLGVLYYNFGETEKAILTLKKTIELKPNYRDPYLALAVIYEQEKQKEEAKKIINAWLLIDPGDADFKNQFSDLLK